jgi:glucose/arabinose dehydrogenase
MVDRIARLVDQGEGLVFDSIILDDIPAAKYHAGCRLKFGPDGKLFITTGDALEKQLAQETDSLAGKILRVNPDGSIPVDNPNPDSPVFSTGHRNPQGITWDKVNRIMYSSEHGPSGFDGPGGGDEINIIIPGGNYGWPLVSHDQTLEGMINPIIQFTPAEAPASLLYYDNDALPFFKGNLFFGALRGEGLVRLVLSEDGRSVELVEKIVDDVGRVREVTIGPDGLIYITTSNRDGRVDMRAGDDKIYRIIPTFD